MLKRYIFFPAICFIVIFFWALPALAEMIVDTAWVRIYNGPRNLIDQPSAIAVDASGNVYVTGNSPLSGWYDDYATIKYYPNGDTAWVRGYNGPGNIMDAAHALAVDSSGYVYVTGVSYSSWTDCDYATIKYYPNGDTAWVRRYNGPENDFDYATAITVDSFGNVYVTGGSEGSELYSDYATIKYDPDGDTAWVRRYNGPGDTNDVACAIVVDRSFNVYVTGGSYGSGTGNDYATIKYDPNGDTAWVRRYNGPGNGDDGAGDIAVDDSGNVYVTGGSYGSGTSYDCATIKYDPNGDTAWVRRYNGPGNGDDVTGGIAVDDSGNVYVTGRSMGSGGNSDYVTIKYYPNGDTAWVRGYNGPGNSHDAASGIIVDDLGNIYVTGYSPGIVSDWDIATIKYVQFMLGDANNDGSVDVGDVVYLINYLFKNGPPTVPILKAGDAYCDGVVDVGDVVYIINYLFKGGTPPSC